MIPILKQIVNWFTRNFRAVAVGLVSLLIATVFV
jgi:chromosome segregation ATPase|nr:MAG TPA: YSIRK type signal peptide [Caudoviricetes sp.]